MRWNACTSLDLEGALAEAGLPAEAFARLWRALWRQPFISAETLELCRLTFARLHNDALEVAAENPAAPSTRLGDGRDLVLAGKALATHGLIDPERSILTFAEYYWLGAGAIPDEAADAVKSAIGEDGLVFLIEALGVLDGRMRAARCLRGLVTAFDRESAVAV